MTNKEEIEKVEKIIEDLTNYIEHLQELVKDLSETVMAQELRIELLQKAIMLNANSIDEISSIYGKQYDIIMSHDTFIKESIPRLFCGLSTDMANIIKSTNKRKENEKK